uniref:Threonylcarbamoyl-AMP synthase n=1 Tax=Anas zonorhyncha TaxID=75864 RepID=A0A8B9VSF9_9AVES
MATAAGNTPRLLPGGSGRGCSDAEGAGWGGKGRGGGTGTGTGTGTWTGAGPRLQQPPGAPRCRRRRPDEPPRCVGGSRGEAEAAAGPGLRGGGRYCHVNVPDELLRDLLPGPVTLVLKRSEELNKDLNPFTSLVGVRIPNHPFIRELARACSGPLALTSANISSQARDVSLLTSGGRVGYNTKAPSGPKCLAVFVRVLFNKVVQLCTRDLRILVTCLHVEGKSALRYQNGMCS